MKKDSSNKIRLGIFVTVAIALFTLGIFFIGQRQRLFVRTINVKFTTSDVNGLQAGNKVRFSGIDIGTVSSVDLTTDTTVVVEMNIERKVKKFIKKDAQASVGSEGLMGDKVVNIAPGTSTQKEIENNDEIACVDGSSMEKIMAHVKVVAKNAEKMSTDMADIVHNIHDGKGSVGKLFMDTSFANNLDKTIVNIKEGAGGFKKNMDAASNTFLLKPYFKKKEKEKEKDEKSKEKEKEKEK